MGSPLAGCYLSRWLAIVVTCAAIFGCLAPLVAAPRGQAYLGSPIGVGKVTLTLHGSDPGSAWETSAITLTESSGRAVYPVAMRPFRVLPRLQNLLMGNGNRLLAPDSDEREVHVPRYVTIYFLFTGQAPLELVVHSPEPQTVILRPIAPPPRIHDRTLRAWWREYTGMLDQQRTMGDYPPLVEQYLTASLGQRLSLRVPRSLRDLSAVTAPEKLTLPLLMGSEELQLRSLAAIVDGQLDTAPATVPLPPVVDWLPWEIAAPDGGAKTEPMADHVPADCFYVRFGSFSNYLWLTSLIDEYGGDIARMVTLRGYHTGLNDKIESQLGLKQDPLSQVFGNQVIADVALIGRDTFTENGPALGILFQARNGLLANSLKKQRDEAFTTLRKAGAKRETITIAGSEVSYYHTPDNRLRSFYVANGDFHLVSTSRAVVEGFLRVANGESPLSQLAEFQSARADLPLDREDTVFVFLSSRFFQGLLSPQYRVELSRRLRADSEMELLQLARLAYVVESKAQMVRVLPPAGVEPGDASIATLVEAGLLPVGFGERADGSRPIVEGGTVIDSLRGARGSFVPVPDVPLDLVTVTEAETCRRVADYLQTRWQRMDPMVVGIKRFELKKVARGDESPTERVRFDLKMSPFEQNKYGWITSILGQPSRQRIACPEGTLLTVDAMLQGGRLRPELGDHHLFIGLQDAPSEIRAAKGGVLETLRLLRAAPSYAVTWPEAGWLDFMSLRDEPDQQGYSLGPLGLWRRQWEDYSAASFHRDILEQVTPRLHQQLAEDLAQVRIHMENANGTELASWINAVTADRALRASVGNVRFLHGLTSNFQIDRAASLEVAQRLLGVKLICALGGEYTLTDEASGGHWRSTGWTDHCPLRVRNPEDYTAPVLQWLRGADASLLMEDDQLVAHGYVDMRRDAKVAPVKLPSFNKLFGFSGQKKKAAQPKVENAKPKSTNRPGSADAEPLPPTIERLEVLPDPSDGK